VAEGENRWPAVHRSDAASLVCLAVERAPAGSVLHAVGEEGVRMRDIAEVISRNLDIPTASIAPDGAVAHFGHLGAFVGVDCPASAEITRRSLGWDPTGPSLLEDLEAGHYDR
jgi:nucleoside-diphosphate-sugar epimerase